ncbi:MAG: hypothetical protein ABI175_03895, partial [Polyangiales bacterium]
MLPLDERPHHTRRPRRATRSVCTSTRKACASSKGWLFVVALVLVATLIGACSGREEPVVGDGAPTGVHGA